MRRQGWERLSRKRKKSLRQRFRSVMRYLVQKRYSKREWSQLWELWNTDWQD